MLSVQEKFQLHIIMGTKAPELCSKKYSRLLMIAIVVIYKSRANGKQSRWYHLSLQNGNGIRNKTQSNKDDLVNFKKLKYI